MGLYPLVGALLRLTLGFYFRRIERFGLERVPARGPVLFASNHPNSLADAFVIGASVGRPVSFVATVQLFRLRPVAWLLGQCGVIPINRVKDDPSKMRSVADTFEAVFKVLEASGAVAIFPEGITHDDSQVKEVKTGAARIALELEHRHGGALGLSIVPVGLSYSAKERYRSDVLVNFGEPIPAAAFLGGYAEERRRRVQELTARVEERLRELVLHLPALEDARLVTAIKRLYLERLRVGNVIVAEALEPRAEELALTKAIAGAVRYIRQKRPERVRDFARRLDTYERWLARLGLAEAPGQAGGPERFRRRLAWTIVAVAGGLPAFYGWAHRLLPLLVVRWAVARYADVGRHRAQIGTTAMIAGALSFGLFYAACVWAMHRWKGWPASLWYALSLPAAGLFAHWYLGWLGVVAQSLRGRLLRSRSGGRRVAALEAGLLADIEDLRAEYRRDVLGK